MLRVALSARPLCLDTLLSGLVPWVHLYDRDIPISWCMDREDVHEVQATGYTAQLATGWAPSLLDGGVAFSIADPLLFTREGSAVGVYVFGYFVTNNEDGPLLWAERGRAAPYAFSTYEDSVVVVPRLTLRGLPGDPAEPAVVMCGRLDEGEAGASDS